MDGLGRQTRTGRRRSARAPLLPLHLDAADPIPLHRQLYGGIRELILSGRLAPGARLPSSRTLAQDLRVSRNTVLLGLEQLWSEGYVEGRIGAGTFVSGTLPDGLLAARAVARPAAARAAFGARERSSGNGPPAGPSARGALLAASARTRDLVGRSSEARAFVPGQPDCSDFPFDLWARLLAKGWRRPGPALFAAADPAGYGPLRAAIADYLRSARAVRCDAGQVIVLSGIRQAVDLAARVLLDPGEAAAMEDPGFPGIRAALAAAGVRVRPLPVDHEGLCLPGEEGGPVRLVCVAPSHQYPLGITMSLARRLDLLAWARAADAWILEDDYDSEFRYAGRPLSALQGLDGEGRVLYAGSFSKVLFPSLRIAYLVVPPALAETFCRARAALDDHPPMTAQPALAEFMAAGHFAAHVRRMRKRYEARQEALLAAAERHLGGLLSLARDPAGMHLVADLAPALAAQLSDREASARAAAAGIAAPPLSDYFVGAPVRHALLLGYASVPEVAIEPAVRRLAAALRKAGRTDRTRDSG